jgi:hypothetical protein
METEDIDLDEDLDEDGPLSYPNDDTGEGGAGGDNSPGQAAASPSAPAIDTEGLVRGIVGGLSGVIEQVGGQIRGSIPQPGTPEKPRLTKEQIGEKNRALQALLLSDDVDVEEALIARFTPVVEERIRSSHGEMRQPIQATMESAGEQIAEQFKARVLADTPEPLRKKAGELIDERIKPENYAWLAGLPAAQRKQVLEDEHLKLEGRLAREARTVTSTRAPSRNLTPGSAIAGEPKTDKVQAEFEKLPSKEQKNVLRLAAASAKQAGLEKSVDLKKYNAHIRESVKAYVSKEDEE